MSDSISYLRAPAHPRTTAGVQPVLPTERCRAEKCEFPIHIGLFFDGTRNNQDWADPELGGKTHLAAKKDSNVARLFRAYPDQKKDGYYRFYITGVGTPFEPIGETGSSSRGMGFGAGGDGRIVFGLLSVLNAMKQSISNEQVMIGKEAVRALCTYAWLPMSVDTETIGNHLSPNDQWALDQVGMKYEGGLLTKGGHSHRTKFLKQQLAQLAQQIAAQSHPKLKEVFIDVFGFSRGAAEARVFCNWLDECFEGDKLAGVTAHIRFLGIFDTVAAVGVGPAASGSRWANGHSDWGDEKNLRISPRVRNCEHYVAMHEQRESFPLEDVKVGESMPANCRQFRFPGMHSDVGGGYRPNEQGKSFGDDASKLSQIPLNEMYNAAKAALVPLDMKLAKPDQAPGAWDPFNVSKKLDADYKTFLQLNGVGEREVADCLLDILAWRWARRTDYAEQDFVNGVNGASVAERNALLGAHQVFLRDAYAIQGAQSRLQVANDQVNAYRSSGSMFNRALSKAEDQVQQNLAKWEDIDAVQREVYQGLLKRKPMPQEMEFFAAYCHDSYAGFTPFDVPVVGHVSRNAPWEDGGYLRYRTRFAGDELRMAMEQMANASSAQA
ncbi:T6SS phospholipase effector Tle1-like catalytic domain-containing protein [Ralstonia sp. UBA689]|uniref:T6SS phospholipase effector Tle1-like catalytic domain-containing protein n=1 Tax=Ralstonia sp. UBA689 TaxID=1947373 RepID=UPI0025CBB4C0|nr:DUF2235 domain-containing protein [Ralstonia sp. UBA689]